jgi:hypothetical protein
MASATFQRGLTAVLDTYLIYASETNFGTADPLQIGNSATVGKGARPIGRALLRFDLSAIPAGSTISSAVLTLKNTGGSIAANYQFAARRITQPAWTELGATHLTYDGINNWELGGGDTTATGQDTVTVAGGSSDLVFANLAVLVADALALRGGLLHLLVRNTAESTGTVDYVNVYSSENASASNRPTLVVNYTPPVVVTHPGTAGRLQDLVGNLGA